MPNDYDKRVYDKKMTKRAAKKAKKKTNKFALRGAIQTIKDRKARMKALMEEYK